MRLALTLAFSAAIPMLAGCGSEKPKAADAAPFIAALDDFLQAGSMDMKVDRIESIQVTGDTATVKARMATKGELYSTSVKPLWAVIFNKQGGAWKVTKWAQEGGG